MIRAGVCGDAAGLDARDARLRRIYGAVLASALLSFCSFHPVDLGLLAWIALVPLLVVGAREGRWVTAGMAYAATFLYHLPGLSWIALTTPEGWLTTVFLEGFYGVALVCGALWVRRRRGLPLVLILPMLGVALEWIRGNFPFIAFPWLFWGHTQHARSTLIQIVDVTSTYGLTALVLAVNGALAEAAILLEDRRREARDLGRDDRLLLKKWLLPPAAAIVAVLLYGVVRSAHVRSAIEEGPRLLVVQVDVPQTLKEGGAVGAQTVAAENLALTNAALGRSPQPVDAIVWSETVWLFPVRDERKAAGRVRWDEYVQKYQRDPRPQARRWVNSWLTLQARLHRLVAKAGVPVLVGALDRGWVDGGGPHNSYYQFVPDPVRGARVAARYDKIDLVPVSEYIPFRGTFFFRFFKGFVPPGFTVFEPGRLDQPLFEVGEHRLAPDICFEISFPELLRSFTQRGATVHVCPANDAWFVRGDRGEKARPTAEVFLARAHTRFRAIENRRGIVRCVNRGISLVMDPTGEVTARVERLDAKGRPRTIGVAGTLTAVVPTTSLRSFYVRFGDVFAYACLAASVAWVVLAARGARTAEIA
ncbi:MAG: apolipoprotein N-acyltransferase [Planctomycetota bacterium]|nr:MAG: apolipoprotein N-acyltransferase [Planctomycetota bacterium]